MAVVMLCWRDCLVLVRERGCEGERVVVFAKKCGCTIADGGAKGDVLDFEAAEFPESPQPSRSRAKDGKLRSTSPGLHNLQANDKIGYCVIRQFFIFHVYQ